jgi:hypothetical protein
LITQIELFFLIKKKLKNEILEESMIKLSWYIPIYTNDNHESRVWTFTCGANLFILHLELDIAYLKSLVIFFLSLYGTLLKKVFRSIYILQLLANMFFRSICILANIRSQHLYSLSHYVYYSHTYAKE